MARYRVTVIKTDGTISHVEQDTTPELKQLQDGVAGSIEVIPDFKYYEGENCVAFCNEEGKLEGLPFNGHATREWLQQSPVYLGRDVLCGDIIIVSGTESALEEL